MNRHQIVRTTVISAIILMVVVSLDFLVNVLLMPGVTPYTPWGTVSIVLMVTPAAVAYLILQNAKIQDAQLALAEERVARLAADGANAAKTQFLANMSHELRTPLNAIIGYAEIMEEDAASALGVEDSRRIQRAAHHLLELINEILDHAKLEAGKLELREAPTDLAPLFEEVAEAMRVMAAKNGNALEVEADEDIGMAFVDAMRLKQCLLNLASNATKFTRDGRVKLRVRAIGDDKIRFDVFDTGIGMTADTQTRLFQPFVQADSSITRQFGGTGLGLVITKRLIDSMGGVVTVRSVEGRGSTFSIVIKRNMEPAEAVTRAA